jgi:hypothetical protein
MPFVAEDEATDVSQMQASVPVDVCDERDEQPEKAGHLIGIHGQATA